LNGNIGKDKNELGESRPDIIKPHALAVHEELQRLIVRRWINVDHSARPCFALSGLHR